MFGPWLGRRRYIKGVLLAIMMLSARPVLILADSSPYPRILRLTSADPMFKQLSDSIAQAYRAENRNAEWPDFFVAQYTVAAGDDLFSLAARFNLPYETLVTLNRLSQASVLQTGDRLLVPSLHGIFVPELPESDLEILLSSRQEFSASPGIRVTLYDSKASRHMLLLPGQRFSPTERGFFLNPGFRLPVSGAVLSSRFGIRRSPIDGHVRMHNGIDLAAPDGTPVFPARPGRVVEQGHEPVLGKYIIIDHGGGLRSVYGHLSSIKTVLNQNVFSATVIGTVGSTGWSTGPHLHFEIRIGSAPRNPSDFLPGLTP